MYQASEDYAVMGNVHTNVVASSVIQMVTSTGLGERR